MTQLLVSYCCILTLIVFSIGPSYWPDHGHSGGQQNTRSNHQHQGHSPAWWDQHWIVHWIPYSRKLSREKTFANWWKNQKNRFSRRKLSRIARLCRAKDATPPNFAEKTFTNSHKTTKFTKVWKFPAIQYALSTKTIFINTVMYCVLRVCVCVCVCVSKWCICVCYTITCPACSQATSLYCHSGDAMQVYAALYHTYRKKMATNDTCWLQQRISTHWDGETGVHAENCMLSPF